MKKFFTTSLILLCLIGVSYSQITKEIIDEAFTSCNFSIDKVKEINIYYSNGSSSNYKKEFYNGSAKFEFKDTFLKIVSKLDGEIFLVNIFPYSAFLNFSVKSSKSTVIIKLASSN